MCAQAAEALETHGASWDSCLPSCVGAAAAAVHGGPLMSCHTPGDTGGTRIEASC